jgi:hypothetical protein
MLHEEERNDMESRAFIRTAAAVIAKIEAGQQTIGTAEELRTQREGVQKEINLAFSGLQNPTLPSATKLRDTAVRAGYQVNPLIQQKIQQAESVWY